MIHRHLPIALCCAALLVAATDVCLAKGVAPAAATEADKASAREYFGAAMKAWKDKRFEEALGNFRASYDKVASPNSHFMVVRTLSSLGRSVEAYRETVRLIAEADEAAKSEPKYADTAKAAREQLAKLRPAVALVTVVGAEAAAAPGEPLTVAGRTIAREHWGEPVAVEPGPAEVQLGEGPPRAFTVAAGGEHTVDLTPAPPPPPVSYQGPDRRIMALVAGGVGAAGLISFGIFGGLALAKYNDLDDQCPDKRCPTDLSSDTDSGRTFQTVANVSLVIGLVGVAAGAGLFTWALLDEPSDGGQPAQTARLHVGPTGAMMEVVF